MISLLSTPLVVRAVPVACFLASCETGLLLRALQGIAVGATVTLTVSRGYALPALDSDTQVITTSAVGPDSPGDFLPNDGLAVEFVRVHLLKAATGFGFTVADCDQVRGCPKITSTFNTFVKSPAFRCGEGCVLGGK